MNPSLMLINPWIYDFAAYDLWSKPLGLLYLAGYLRTCGFKVDFIDCMDTHHPGITEDPSLSRPLRRSYGTGKYWKKKVPNPPPLQMIPRSYSRYGITRQIFLNELKFVHKPDAILVTSLMTYWYPGVQEAISLAREAFPGVPIILGGIYARLCREHALQCSGADLVDDGGSLHKPDSVLKILEKFGIKAPRIIQNGSIHPYPAFDLLHRIGYICLLTSEGCPYRCRYCASHFLNPLFFRREPLEVLDEIRYWHQKYSIQDFAFYDDALLVGPENHITLLLENLIKQGLRARFHTPNALHVRELTSDIAGLLYLSGFKTIRLGLETSDMRLHNELDRKISEGEFEQAVHNLKKAGFTKDKIGAYILIGLPGQSVDSVIDTIRFVGGHGATPYLAEYSPLPHTPLWKEALSHSRYDLASEPLFQNNSLLPCWDDSQIAFLPELKKLVQEIRSSPIPG